MPGDGNKQSPARLISIAAHELKAPIAAIEGYLRIIRDKSAGDNPKAYEEMIDRCLIRAGEMRNLISDFLDLGRLESGQARREAIRIDAAESVRYILEAMEPLIRDRNITVTLNVGNDACLIADPQDMQVILRNLLSNAVKYNVDGGRIDIDIHSQDDTIIIVVTDTGIGIASDDQKQIFREFSRVKNGSTRNIPGSGLGLWIVKQLVEHYRGRIDLTSAPGKGTAVTVVLPRNMDTFKRG